MAKETKKKLKASSIKKRIEDQIRGQSTIGSDFDLKNKILASLDQEDDSLEFNDIEDDETRDFLDRLEARTDQISQDPRSLRERIAAQFDPAIERLGKKAVSGPNEG